MKKGISITQIMSYKFLIHLGIKFYQPYPWRKIFCSELKQNVTYCLQQTNNISLSLQWHYFPVPFSKWMLLIIKH